MIFNPKKIRKEFPLYRHNKGLVYLDSAATSLTPTPVIEALTDYYKKYNANVHRGVYRMSILATEMYDRAHRVVAEFINAEHDEVVITSGATQSLNMLARGLEYMIGEGDAIVLTRLEHHANLVPWLELAKRTGASIRYIELTHDYQIDMQSAREVIDDAVKIVSVTHASNTLGTIVPVENICAMAREVGALSIIDAAQSVPHFHVDVKAIGCDFLVFSGHKVLGPTGAGVLYGTREQLQRLEPSMFGGAMISEVTYMDARWGAVPHRFEAGTPNISSAIGMAAGLEYVRELGRDNVWAHEKQLTEYALQALEKVPGLRIIGPRHNRVGVISFVIDGVHSFDAGTLLDQQGIAVRTGHHCTQPLLEMLGEETTIRISLYFYNSEQEIDKLVKGLTTITTVAKQS